MKGRMLLNAILILMIATFMAGAALFQLAVFVSNPWRSQGTSAMDGPALLLFGSVAAGLFLLIAVIKYI